MKRYDYKIMNGLFDILTAMEVDSKPSKARLAACIAYKGKIQSYGFNSFEKTHPFQARFGVNKESIYPHAEIAAINNFIKKRLKIELSDCDIYVCRVKRASDRKTVIYGLAKPCSGCMRCIKQFGLKRIVYSLDNTNNFEVLL